MWVTGFGFVKDSPAAFSTLQKTQTTGSNLISMWVTGFEPAKAESHRILSPTYLTTLAHPHKRLKSEQDLT